MKAVWPVAWIAMAGAVQAADLPEGTFRVVTLGDHAVGTEPGLTIDLADGRVSGSAGCNRYFGAIGAQGPLFSVLGTTRMACDPVVMALEDQFLSALARVDALDLDKETLTLFAGADVLVVARR